MQALLNYAVSMECSFQFFNFLGTPQLSDTTDVEITVTDVNDNPPKFAQEGYTVAVSEDVPIGTSIIQVFQIAILLNSFWVWNILCWFPIIGLLQVSASDADIGLNGRVRYSLEDTETFIMEPITGVVRINRALDRESVATYQLVAVASDRATPPLSSTVGVQDVIPWSRIWSPAGTKFLFF